MNFIPPTGAVTPVSDIVTGQVLPGSTILTDPNDKKELARKISKTARLHLGTIQGVSTGLTGAGVSISIP